MERCVGIWYHGQKESEGVGTQGSIRMYVCVEERRGAEEGRERKIKGR